ncbi:TauD/TfdA family dioxygenase [Aeromicrobium halocynthiae]|uniref:TauD/TfdA family dioxygenase n=1 Tax=Aeromicrobium halocynthiae TaxID=560557 RepID=A0ABN2VU28_9ACTN
MTPLGQHVGARIDGLRLHGGGGGGGGGGLDAGTVAAVRSALLRHRVVFLRGQDHLDDTTHHEVAELLGPTTTPHPTVQGDGQVLVIDSEHGKADAWHTDVTFCDRPPALSLLRPEQLTPYGGTTVWASTVAAYETLHPALQAMADRLWAVHTNLYDYAAEVDEQRIGGVDVAQEAYREEFGSQVFETEHPVVHVHPETGERSLLIGQFVKRIVGLSSRESAQVQDLLQRAVTRLENAVRWDWQPGDLAIWDNRAMQHYAVADYGDHERRMRRVTVAGDVPVSVEGRRSVARIGDSSTYAGA